MRRSCEYLKCLHVCIAEHAIAESPESGSARKRPRLSSPTYEEHFPITQEDMATFDELEKQLSQAMPVVPSQSRSLPSEAHKSHDATTQDVDFLGGHDEEQGYGHGSTIKGAHICT